MSYEPPPLEPELRELEAELRGIHPLPPDFPLTQRLSSALGDQDRLYEAVTGESSGAVLAFPWKRYGSAAAVAAAAFVFGFPLARVEPLPGAAETAAALAPPSGASAEGHRAQVRMIFPNASRPPSPVAHSPVIPASPALSWTYQDPQPGDTDIFIPSPQQGAVVEAPSPYGFLGVCISPVSPHLRAQLGDSLLQSEQGIVVERVMKASPAGAAGLQPYDIITAVDGEPVLCPKKFVETVRKTPPGSELRLEVLRAGRRTEVSVVLVPLSA